MSTIIDRHWVRAPRFDPRNPHRKRLTAREYNEQRATADPATIHDEIDVLHDEIDDVNAAIAKIAPDADLEDALLSYGRDPGPVAGAGEKKRALVAELDDLELWRRQAFVMLDAVAMQGEA